MQPNFSPNTNPEVNPQDQNPTPQPDSSAYQPAQQQQYNTQPPTQTPVQPTFVPQPAMAHPTEAAHQNDNHTPQTEYVSNPFLVGIRNFSSSLKFNAVPLMLMFVLLLASIFVAGILNGIFSMAGNTAGASIIGLITSIILIVVIVYVYTLFLSAYYAIAVKSAQKEQQSTSAIIKLSSKKVLVMIGIGLITVPLILVGLILLIVPGLFLLARFSLAPAIVFAENTGVIGSLKRSWTLTKGHVFELLGSLMAGSLLSSGSGPFSLAFTASQTTGRYYDLKTLHESQAPKPAVHWLNYLLAVVPILFVIALVVLTVFAFNSVQNRVKEMNNPTTESFNSSPFDTPSDRFQSPDSNPFNFDTPSSDRFEAPDTSPFNRSPNEFNFQ